MNTPGNLFEIDTATMSVRVLSPAGLVLATIHPVDQMQLVQTILGLWLAANLGQQLPGTVAMRYPGAPPPVTLAVSHSITNPVRDGNDQA